jgi:hypothetical protein
VRKELDDRDAVPYKPNDIDERFRGEIFPRGTPGFEYCYF